MEITLLIIILLIAIIALVYSDNILLKRKINILEEDLNSYKNLKEEFIKLNEIIKNGTNRHF